MTETTTRFNLNDALTGLLDKYSVEATGSWRIVDGGESLPDANDVLTLASGDSLTETERSEQTVPLRPWRHQRRFVELKRLIDEKTVSPLLMCRFACLTDGREMSLRAILYREFDLVQWLSGKPIVAVHASMAGNRAANAIVRLADGVIGSVEAGTTLPTGAAVQDRHELIARRGVASDRVVDTQVAQSSIYEWTDAGRARHTDVDAELFGLSAEQVSLVRSAYEVLCDPTHIAYLRQEHRRLRRLVELAYESNRSQQRLAVEGDLA